MQPGVIYRLSWNTVETISTNPANNISAMAMIVDILDTENLIPDVDTPTVIDLTPSGQPLVIKVINNDRDKYSPIRAKQSVIQFMSDRSAFQDVTTFSDSSDNRWKVEITADSNPVFYGFLMLPDSSMPFQPDPNLVVLTASDHLGVLKDLPLVDDAGENPVGKLRIATLVALALKQTGLSLDIVVINNLRSGSGAISPAEVIFGTFSLIPQIRVASAYGAFFYVGQIINVTGSASNNTTFHAVSISDDGSTTYVTVSEAISSGESSTTATLTDDLSSGHFYDKIYLDIKTFEQEIGISEFCYSVLEKILGEDCFLSQWQGKWYIMRVDEYDGNPIYPATFDSDGNFVQFEPSTNFNKSIGATEIRRFANADQLLEFDRPSKFIKEAFKFDYADEILCNLTLARGTHNATLTTADFEALDPECWVFEQNNLTPNQGPGTGGAILVYSVSNVETARYLHIFASATTLFLYFRSEDRIPLQEGDKFKLSVDWKYDNNPGGSGHYRIGVVMFRLYGDDGSHWFLNAVAGYNSIDPRTYWILSDATWATNNRFLWQEGQFDQDDLSQWTTASCESAPTPVKGRLEIWLVHNSNTNLRGRSFAALSFDYVPYLRGTYGKLTGDYNKVTRAETGFLAKREKDVFIQDALKPLFKGALLFRSSEREIFTGTIFFSSPDVFAFNLATGYKNYLFYPGEEIVFTGTNAGIYRVVSVFYHIIGNYTDVHVSGGTFTAVGESVIVSEVVYALTTQWYTAAPFYTADPPASNGAPPDSTYLHPYGYIQAFSVWNQYRNANRILSGGVLGLGSMWCDAFDKVSLTDTNPNTDNRYFMLISFEQNWKTALWSGVFIEDYRTDIGKIYSDGHEFQYLTT